MSFTKWHDIAWLNIEVRKAVLAWRIQYPRCHFPPHICFGVQMLCLRCYMFLIYWTRLQARFISTCHHLLGKAKELIWSHQTHGEDNKKDSCSAPFRDKSPWCLIQKFFGSLGIQVILSFREFGRTEYRLCMFMWTLQECVIPAMSPATCANIFLTRII